MLLLMTVEPGFGGQKFLDVVLPKVRRARELIKGRDLPSGSRSTAASAPRPSNAAREFAPTSSSRATPSTAPMTRWRRSATSAPRPRKRPPRRPGDPALHRRPGRRGRHPGRLHTPRRTRGPGMGRRIRHRPRRIPVRRPRPPHKRPSSRLPPTGRGPRSHRPPGRPGINRHRRNHGPPGRGGPPDQSERPAPRLRHLNGQTTTETPHDRGRHPLAPTIVTAEDVPNGKPDPSGYLQAAAQLGVDPAACVVIEDAPAYIAAGRAGLRHRPGGDHQPSGGVPTGPTTSSPT